MKFLQGTLKPPHFENNDQTRAAQLLHIILLAYLVSAGIFLVALPFVSPEHLGRALPVLLFLPIFVLLLRMMRRGQVRLAAFILLTLNWCLLAGFAFSASGVRDSSYISQILLIFFAGFLLGRGAAIVLVVVDLLLGLVMIAAENAGYITPIDYPPLADWYSIGTLFVGVAILVVVITRNIDGALIRARKEIAERKQIEQELRKSEEKYRLLVEYSHQGMVIAQANPIRLNFASRPMQAITGYTPDELMAFGSTQLHDLIHPEDGERFFGNFQARLAGKTVEATARYRIIHRSGEVRYVDLFSARIDYEGEPATQTVFLDVSEQVEIERLKIRFQKEQEHNALIQRVVSMLSHDLRTPLAVISSSRDILDQYFDRLTEEKRREKLDTIRRQVQFAIEMLEDTVSTARGSLNTREFAPKPINLATLCQVSVDEILVVQDGKHLLQFVNKGQVEMVSVDEVLVSRILLNLLSNAVKYSPDDTAICLELDRREDWIVLRVIDHGQGIPAEDLAHIFDPFYRANNVQNVTGTGLGLSVVKNCVDRHQGRIHVESEPGKGSIFTVELPLNAAPHSGDI